jgi:hypothetical protein
MEMSQGNSLYSYLKQQKYHFSKTEDRKVKQVLSGVDTSGRGEDISKGCRRVNMVKILCTHEKIVKHKPTT